MEASESGVRVVLIGCTGLLGDIVARTIAAEPDLDVVADVTSAPGDLDLTALGADIVVWNEADEERVAQWLDASSRTHPTRVLAVMTDGQRAALWELTPQRLEVGALSPQTLVTTIRGTGLNRVTS